MTNKPNPLLVPVNLEAKYISNPTKVPQQSNSERTITLEPGVHLHWALPSALTTARSGVKTGQSFTAFPAVPTHWLVVRTGVCKSRQHPIFGFRKTLSKRAVKAWLVESINRNIIELTDSVDIHLTGTPENKVFTMFGEVAKVDEKLDLDGWGVWEEQDENTDQVNVTDAAYYPSSMNRFGFYDDLADLKQLSSINDNRISYTVVGWYLDNDPLTGSTKPSELLERWKWYWDDSNQHLVTVQSGNSSVSTYVSSSDVVFSSIPQDLQRHYSSATPDLLNVHSTQPSGIVCHGSLFDLRVNYNSDDIKVPELAEPRARLSSSIHRATVEAFDLPERYSSDAWIDNLQEIMTGDMESYQTPAALSDAHSRQHEQTFQGIPGRGTFYVSVDLPRKITPFEEVGLGGLGSRLQYAGDLDPGRQKAGGLASRLELEHTRPWTFEEIESPLPGSLGNKLRPLTRDEKIDRLTEPQVALRFKLKSLSSVTQLNTHPTKFRVTNGSDSWWFDVNNIDDMLEFFSLLAPEKWLELFTKPEIYEDPGPRWYHPSSPHLVLSNIGRSKSMRYGGDNRFMALPEGGLACRLPDDLIKYLSIASKVTRGEEKRSSVHVVLGDDLLTGLSILEKSGVPTIATDLVREAALFDINNASLIAQTWSGAAIKAGEASDKRKIAQAITDALRARLFLQASQAKYLNLSDEVVDLNKKIEKKVASILKPNPQGVWPSPVAWGIWTQPWIPLVADCEVKYLHLPVERFWKIDGIPLGEITSGSSTASNAESAAESPAGAEMGLQEWLVELMEDNDTVSPPASLELLDYLLRNQANKNELKNGVEELCYREHVPLTTSIARTWHRQLVTREMASYDGFIKKVRPKPSFLNSLGMNLEEAERLSGSLTGFDEFLRSRGKSERSGSLQLTRVHVIDAFGEKKSIVSPEDKLLSRHWIPVAPRIPTWARLQFRLTSATIDNLDADDNVSPVCGFLIPDMIEHALEVFDHEGQSLGQIIDTEVEGNTSPKFRWHPWNVEQAGKGSDEIKNVYLKALVKGIEAQHQHLPEVDSNVEYDYGETGLSALVRTIETARFSVNFSNRFSDWRLRFMRRPIAVLRVRLWLEANDRDASEMREESAHHWGNESLGLPLISVKIGDELRPNDGVLGAFLPGSTDEESRFVCVSQQSVEQAFNYSMSEPTQDSPFFQTEGLGQKAVEHSFITDHDHHNAIFRLDTPNEVTHLTLLQDIEGDIFTTCGILPRKRTSIPEGFIKATTKKLEPSIKVGPLLAVPMADKHLHLTTSVPKQQGFIFNWKHEETLESEEGIVRHWVDEKIGNVPKIGAVPSSTARLCSGWYRLTQKKRDK